MLKDLFINSPQPLRVRPLSEQTLPGFAFPLFLKEREMKGEFLKEGKGEFILKVERFICPMEYGLRLLAERGGIYHRKYTIHHRKYTICHRKYTFRYRKCSVCHRKYTFHRRKYSVCHRKYTFHRR